MNARISAIGTYVPSKIIDNKWYEQFIETNSEWIISRTGIKERRHTAPEEYTSDICVNAIKNLLSENPGINLTGVDFILVATTTADQVMPSMASQIQFRFEIPDCGCLDIMAACAGFCYGLVVAKGLIASGAYKKVLVLGAETLSKFTDFKDRATCILFGDGAGVAMVEASVKPGLLGCVTGTDGSHGQDLYLSQHRSVVNGEEIVTDGNIHQNGKVVFKWAVRNISLKIKELLALNNLELTDLDWLILHSANLRIIEAVATEINYPMEKMLTSIEYFGNTSSASIPLAWDLAKKAGKIQPGNKMLLIGFGGGLTFAGIVVEV